MVSCEKPRVAANRRLIRGFPNGATRRGKASARLAESIGQTEGTRGSETSQYPEEEKSTEIPQVAASETGSAQTDTASAVSGL